MSNVALVIEERATKVGSFLVGRLLPFVQKRAVGPFVFIDHMGPVNLTEKENFDVPPHPHIGLSTLTYLFEGSIMHRDSLGNEIEIKPGAVNWMNAGKGVVHSERTPDYLRMKKKTLHGMQIWVALPKELEFEEASFYHIEEKDLPSWVDDDVKYTLIAGEAFSKTSGVPVHSPLYFIEIINKTEEDKLIDIGKHLYGESALYILDGKVEVEGNIYEDRRILINENAELCSFTLKSNSSIYIFGGKALPQKRYIHWNFVASERETIDRAVEDWKNQKFPKVPNETEFVPYPGKKDNVNLKK